MLKGDKIRYRKRVIKMYELEASEENIKKTISTDVLGRNSSIFNFLKLIYSINTKSTISIDGNWGTGKTFFVKQTELIMNLLNNPKGSDEDARVQSIKDKIKNRIDELGINTYGNTRAIYYNACEYDYFDEPVLTIIADIINKSSNIEILEPKVKESIGEKIDKLFSAFKLKFTLQNNDGNTFELELQKQKGEPKTSILDSIILDKQIETNFKLLLEDLLVEKSNRLVIFVDELDRCNPAFAVRLLERIKYFFNDERFIFVFSTNIDQLQYTVEKYYGNNFDGAYYLQKFFDYQLELPEINIQNYIDYHINLIPKESSYCIDGVIREVLKYKKFNLRDCNKYFDLLQLKYKEIKDAKVENRYYFFIGVLFPALLAIKIKDNNEYRKIKEGLGKEEFYNIVMNCNSIIEFLKEISKAKKIEKNIIDEIYEYIFVRKDDEGLVINSNFSMKRSFVNKMNDLLSYLGEKVTL